MYASFEAKVISVLDEKIKIIFLFLRSIHSIGVIISEIASTIIEIKCPLTTNHLFPQSVLVFMYKNVRFESPSFLTRQHRVTWQR